MQEYLPLKDKVTEIINKIDPWDLISAGAPTDEYEGFINGVVSLIVNHKFTYNNIEEKLHGLDDEIINQVYKKLLEFLFQNKILAVRHYASIKREFLVTDFVNKTELVDIMDEVQTGESDITPAGKKFLEVYYSDKELKELLNSLDDDAANWVHNLVPMELAIFIAQTKGQISTENREPALNPRLLPPELP